MRPGHIGVLVSALLLAATARAQLTATLVGTVSVGDVHAVGVTVIVTSPNMLGSRTVITDSRGNYVFGAIPPGRYRIEFKLSGARQVIRIVDVGLGMTARADAGIELEAVQSISVMTSAPSPLATNEMQTRFDAQFIEDLPHRRTLRAITSLAPGVNERGALSLMISGGFFYDSTYYLDGAVVNEVLSGMPMELAVEDAIQETTVLTGAISAEYGRFTGGVVTALTKSGGNQFSGSLRDNLANARWTAQGALKEPRPQGEIVHIYEATFGGRVIRDRLWFFSAARYFDLDFPGFLGSALLPGSDIQREVPIPFRRGQRERRTEVKLTGQMTPRQTVVGTIIDRDTISINVSALGTALEEKYLDRRRDLPNTFRSLHYNAVLSSTFLVEGVLSRQTLTIAGVGSEGVAPPERGTSIVFNNGPAAASWGGYPSFCSACGSPDERDNKFAKVKGSYYAPASRLGSHSVSFGHEYFEDRRKVDNHVSASDFRVEVLRRSETSNAINRGPERIDGELRATLVSGAGFIVWFPILQASRGNAQKTHSIFVNDRWDVNQRLGLSVGLRYDRNDGRDAGGTKTAEDDNLSPRLGIMLNPFATDRVRLNASYSRYATKINNGLGDAASAAGFPSYQAWLYAGPDIINVNTDEMLDRIFGWFRSQGYVQNRQFLVAARTAGISSQVRERLTTPSVDEFTIGAGFEIGSRGFLRGDYQHRDWTNFFTLQIDQTTGKVFDPLAGAEVDVAVAGNSSDLQREYDAFILQGRYRFGARVDVGGNYTWSRLRGNIEGESATTGPAFGSSSAYPEFAQFERNNPAGLLNADKRHRARVWLTYHLPTRTGNWNTSVLQSFDSGVVYSEVASINPLRSATCPTCIDRTTGGYSFPPTSVTYYFSERGAFRTTDLHNTDIALNYSLKLGAVQLFAQGELINTFNRQGSLGVNTTVNVLRSFNPFTETAVECPQGLSAADCRARFAVATGQPNFGIWQKGPSFGKPTVPTSGASQLPGGGTGHFQIPRTFRLSVGLKF